MTFSCILKKMSYICTQIANHNKVTSNTFVTSFGIANGSHTGVIVGKV